MCKTDKRSKAISINFEKASVLEGDEYQSFRLSLKKAQSREINHQLSMTYGLFDTIETTRGFAGLGPLSYQVIRKTSTGRTPTVITIP